METCDTCPPDQLLRQVGTVNYAEMVCESSLVLAFSQSSCGVLRPKLKNLVTKPHKTVRTFQTVPWLAPCTRQTLERSAAGQGQAPPAGQAPPDQ